MEKSLPLNDCEARKTRRIINRLHCFTHGAALAVLFYYRITTIASLPKTTTILPHILIFIAELILSLIWLLSQASKWNPVARTAYPERLPVDENLPSIDVYICTADPGKEPSLDVMNTVISAMALDYPPQKLHVYLSDDGGSLVTFRAVKLAWGFARVWIPFCNKYEVKNRCPEAYFLREGSGGGGGAKFDDGHFLVDKKDIENRDLSPSLSLSPPPSLPHFTHHSRDSNSPPTATALSPLECLSLYIASGLSPSSHATISVFHSRLSVVHHSPTDGHSATAGHSSLSRQP